MVNWFQLCALCSAHRSEGSSSQSKQSLLFLYLYQSVTLHYCSCASCGEGAPTVCSLFCPLKRGVLKSQQGDINSSEQFVKYTGSPTWTSCASHGDWAPTVYSPFCSQKWGVPKSQQGHINSSYCWWSTLGLSLKVLVPVVVSAPPCTLCSAHWSMGSSITGSQN